MLVLSVKYFAKTSLPTHKAFFVAHNEPSDFQLEILVQISPKGKIFGKSSTLYHKLMTFTLKQDQDVLKQQRS